MTEKKIHEGVAYEIDPLESFLGELDDLLSDEVGSARSTGISYALLRQMAQVPAIAALIQTRITQVKEFAWPAIVGDDSSPGYKFVLKEHGRAPTKDEAAEMRHLTRWMSTCGEDWEDEGEITTFASFLGKTVRDTMRFDQVGWELIRKKNKTLAAFQAVDASTIRKAAPTKEEVKRGRHHKTSGSIKFVQVVNHTPVAQWTGKDFFFGIRRQRTDLEASGYGYPELLELMGVIGSMVNAETYNANNFTNGLHARGILAVKSKMSPVLFRDFTRRFYQMVKGPSKAHKVPVVQLSPEDGESIENISLSHTNREMEFAEWLAYLQKIAASLFQIDMAELGFVYGNEQQSGALQQAGPDQRVKQSRAKGLRSLLRTLSVWINHGIVNRITDKYEFVFTGLDADHQRTKLEDSLQKVKSFMTVNETRAVFGMDPIPASADGGTADMILDAAYLSTSARLLEIQNPPPPEPVAGMPVVEPEPDPLAMDIAMEFQNMAKAQKRGGEVVVFRELAQVLTDDYLSQFAK